MPNLSRSTWIFFAIAPLAAGCQSAGGGMHATYSAAGAGASTIRTAGGEIYTGAGRAIRQPFHDLNMLQDQIAPVLLRAESHPYDLSKVNSCSDVLDQVAELDLALGPDVDMPKFKRKRTIRSADFAASAALDAAGSAAEHFIPMRSTIRQLTGAQRYDNHVKHALLAGNTRRAFLKAVGMAHNCTWPAAPIDFSPTVKVDVAALWTASTPMAAGPVRIAAAPIAPAVGSTVLGTPASAAGASTLKVARVTLISAQTASAPIKVASIQRLRLPSSAPPPEAAAQAWRPAKRTMGGASLEQVSTSASAAPTGVALAPWTSSFAPGAQFVHP